MAGETITINRAPVLTLWAAVVAERLGFDRAEALTLGKVFAGLNAQGKGRMLGIFRPRDAGKARQRKRGEEFWIEIMGKPIPATSTEDGIRAVTGDKPIDPESVERYLGSKFGERLEDAEAALRDLANAFSPEKLGEIAFDLYQEFRPRIASGTRGWGAKGTLDLVRVRALARGA